MTIEGKPKIPPMEWYEGIAFSEKGLRDIYLGSQSLNRLHPDMADQLCIWLNSRLYDWKEEYSSPGDAKIHEDAGRFIYEITGFLPEDLLKYADHLGETYIGQQIAPFPFSVTWVTR